MKIKYLGPAKSINVGLSGMDVRAHVKGKVLEYPKEIGEELLEDEKNRFEAVGGKAEPKASKQSLKTNGKK